ncbi:tetratricopeptide repeat protein [Pseudonocardiaceae bacterium YIM PH 21723]|nr:tetratricopeptide repeat protein [Pseudonocardiaceae bacterium YIM PH 21723]
MSTTSDIARVTSTISDLRDVDDQHGGGACRRTAQAYLPGALRLLTTQAHDAASRRLHRVVAELHSVAGWTAFDTAHLPEAFRHLGVALELAIYSGDEDLQAHVLYRLGRIYLHQEAPAEALALFQRGLSVIGKAGHPLTVAILSANQAWAHAKMADADRALALLGQATDAFARADPGQTASWSRFFDEVDLQAMIGMVHGELARTVHPSHTRSAVPALTGALADYGSDMARSRAFCLITLSICHLLDGDSDEAAVAGEAAIEIGEEVKSTRIDDRMRPLQAQLLRGDAHGLGERIASFVAVRARCDWTAGGA